MATTRPLRIAPVPLRGRKFWGKWRSDGGHAKAVRAAFLGHMIYGALLGLIAGHAAAPVAPVASRA